MEVRVTKRDIVWTYLAQIFNIGTGFLTLPIILNKLSAEEVGMNYLMLTVGSITNLFDLGFVAQFGRNITYILSGAKHIQKEGISQARSNEIDYHLLKNVIDTAQYVYVRMSLFIFVLLLSLGSIYMYNVTDGFIRVSHSFLIWVLFCVSIYFNIYFKYLDSLLNGAAMIEQSRKAMVYSKSVYIILAYLLLLMNFGLISVVIANLISPFVSRHYSYKCFYTKEMKALVSNIQSSKAEIKKTLNTIWATTRLLALNMFGSFASNQAGMFISGFYLTLSELASYGLMLQLFNIVSGLSTNITIAYQVNFCKNRVLRKYKQIIKDLSFGVVVAFIIKMAGAFIIILIAPLILTIIHSNSVLPCTQILVLYSLYSLLHDNMACFCTYITSGNKVPFVKPSLITAFFIVVLMFIFLQTGMGIIGPIIALLLAEGVYSSWKWPLYVIRELRQTPCQFYRVGILEMSTRVYKNILVKQREK